jgi:selenocysteine lyase/cysteine desulfurase
VVFTGFGATGALAKIIDVLQMKSNARLEKRFKVSKRLKPEDRPMVLIGPYEHHSNIILWRESLADVITVRSDRDGTPDIAHLEELLQKYRKRPMIIGSFSAGSNVTGILTDTRELSITLHRYGALAFFDFAGAGPYASLHVNGSSEVSDRFSHLDYKDAVFLSPHKVGLGWVGLGWVGLGWLAGWVERVLCACWCPCVVCVVCVASMCIFIRSFVWVWMMMTMMLLCVCVVDSYVAIIDVC